MGEKEMTPQAEALVLMTEFKTSCRECGYNDTAIMNAIKACDFALKFVPKNITTGKNELTDFEHVKAVIKELENFKGKEILISTFKFNELK